MNEEITKKNKISVFDESSIWWKVYELDAIF